MEADTAAAGSSSSLLPWMPDLLMATSPGPSVEDVLVVE